MVDPKPTRDLALGQTALRTCLWLLLGGWFGSYLLFGAVIAPTAFAVLPSFELAGNLIGLILTKLNLFGALGGVALALVSERLGRGPLLVAAPIALSALCLYSHFGVSSQLTEIRDLAFGLDATAEVTARFDALHRISLSIFIGVGIAVTALIGFHARADSRALR
jgi:MFS-type transporter involved in bile tolerance (Atg22 family)